MYMQASTSQGLTRPARASAHAVDLMSNCLPLAVLSCWSASRSLRFCGLLHYVIESSPAVHGYNLWKCPHLGGLPALPDMAAADASTLDAAALLMLIGSEGDCPAMRFGWSCCTLECTTEMSCLAEQHPELLYCRMSCVPDI